MELHDAIGCYSLCLSLRDGANSLSQEKLAKLADIAAMALGDSLDLKAAKPKVIALLAACDSLAGRSAAG
ncbi:MAG: hypothetical protein IPJ41_05715 [Phycisphaerales bacterium]|nr:hypothetical protein [Phycisphaerales bacterium]